MALKEIAIEAAIECTAFAVFLMAPPLIYSTVRSHIKEKQQRDMIRKARREHFYMAR